MPASDYDPEDGSLSKKPELEDASFVTQIQESERNSLRPLEWDFSATL
jgi:hypothetical protein